MIKLLRLVLQITSELLYDMYYWLKLNLGNIARIVTMLFPFLTYWLGYKDKTYNLPMFDIQAILGIVSIYTIVYYLYKAHNKVNKGTTMPIPKKRFTEKSEYGEVSIENDRIEELILYLGELEDWMERKRYLN